MTGHWIPLIAVVLLWFLSTLLIVWLDNRPRATFRASLIGGGIAGALGLAVLVWSLDQPGVIGAYAGFVGALAIWGWQEMAFLMGAVSGSRREALPPGTTGLARFRLAAQAVLHHEVALAGIAAVLLSLTWGAANPTGPLVFLLLFGLRLTAKFNVFVGVPAMADELLPPHLDYLKSYFGPRRLHPLLLLSIAATTALAAWLMMRALAMPPESGAAVSATLLAGLAALGALEHWFLALPLRDGALWHWATPRRADIRI